MPAASQVSPSGFDSCPSNNGGPATRAHVSSPTVVNLRRGSKDGILLEVPPYTERRGAADLNVGELRRAAAGQLGVDDVGADRRPPASGGGCSGLKAPQRR